MQVASKPILLIDACKQLKTETINVDSEVQTGIAYVYNEYNRFPVTVISALDIAHSLTMFQRNAQFQRVENWFWSVEQ